MSATSFPNLNALAVHLRAELANKKFILVYAYNGTGSHGNYSLYEPQEMLEENKNYFRQILHGFINRYPFNPALFPAPPAPAAAPAPVTAPTL